MVRKIAFATDQNPQQIHALCYQIACEAEENGWTLAAKNLSAALEDWSDTSLSLHTAQVEERMNKRDTKIQRRNQVLYCLGHMEKLYFRTAEVDAKVREMFPESTQIDALGVDQVVAGLAQGGNPILVRSPNEPTYRFAHPKLKLALRRVMGQFYESS